MMDFWVFLLNNLHDRVEDDLQHHSVSQCDVRALPTHLISCSIQVQAVVKELLASPLIASGSLPDLRPHIRHRHTHLRPKFLHSLRVQLCLRKNAFGPLVCVHWWWRYQNDPGIGRIVRRRRGFHHVHEMGQVGLVTVSRDMLWTRRWRSIVGTEPDGQQLHIWYLMPLALFRKNLYGVRIKTIVYAMSTNYLLKDWNSPVRLIPAETSIDHVKFADICSWTRLQQLVDVQITVNIHAIR